MDWRLITLELIALVLIIMGNIGMFVSVQFRHGIVRDVVCGTSSALFSGGILVLGMLVFASYGIFLFGYRGE